MKLDEVVGQAKSSFAIMDKETGKFLTAGYSYLSRIPSFALVDDIKKAIALNLSEESAKKLKIKMDEAFLNDDPKELADESAHSQRQFKTNRNKYRKMKVVAVEIGVVRELK